MYLDGKLSPSSKQRPDNEPLGTSPKQPSFSFPDLDQHILTASGGFYSSATSMGDSALESGSYVVTEPDIISNHSASDYGGDDHSGDSLFSFEASRPAGRVYTKNYARMQEAGEDYALPIAQHRQSVAPLQIDPLLAPRPFAPSGPMTAPAYSRSRSFTGSGHSNRIQSRGAYPTAQQHQQQQQDPYQFSSYSYDQYQAPLSCSEEDVYGYSPMRSSSMSSTPTGPGGWPQAQHSPAFRRGGRGGSRPILRNVIPPDGFVYQVQFKRAHRNFILAPSAPRDIIPGDFVKVEADRGEDMGIVLAKCPVDNFEEVIPTAGYRGRGFSAGPIEKKYLYRLASHEERNALKTKVADEERALETVRQKISERRLPMRILDAEYQFDRHKLTFYFEADQRIDFRDLVSELFSQYKTRIWMQQVDTSNLSMQDAGTELAKATGFLPSDRDDEGLTMRSSSGSEHDLKPQFSNVDAQSSFPPYGQRSGASSQERPFGSAVFSDPWLPNRF